MGTLYENIKALCESKGVSGGKMCVDIGLSKSLMTKLKSDANKTINADTAQKIADYFNVSVGEVLGAEEKPITETGNGLSEEEIRFIEWYRRQASEKDKALVRMIVEGDK